MPECGIMSKRRKLHETSTDVSNRSNITTKTEDPQNSLKTEYSDDSDCSSVGFSTDETLSDDTIPSDDDRCVSEDDGPSCSKSSNNKGQFLGTFIWS